MELILIRHGKTAGNLEKRYIGRTDEPLCEQGIAELNARLAAGLYPAADRVFASPMKRCLETAALLYPQQKPVIVQDLRECDFGVFEGKNYAELNGDAAYQRWIDSAGMDAPPKGESKAEFAGRCCASFWKILENCAEEERAAFVVHGGTIMALLEAFGVPKKGFYDYQLGNGEIYLVKCDRERREIFMEENKGREKSTRYTHGGDWCADGSVQFDFSVNINPLGFPESGKKAYLDSLSWLTRYPDWDCKALRRALGEKLGISPEHIFCGSGAAELIDRIVRANHPKRALLAVPAFSEYERALRAEGCEITYFQLNAENGFLLAEDFRKALTAETDMVFLCNPNNPTGRLIDPKLLSRVQEDCEEKQIWLVVDECFLEFTGKEPEHSRIGRLGSRTIVLRAFTKLYAMPGLRLGYLVCEDREFLQHIAAAGQCWNVSVPAQAVGAAVLTEEAYVQESVVFVRREREFLENGLRAAGYAVVPSEANFILFYAGKEKEKVCGCLAEKGIRIRDCADFRGLAGYCRIAVCTHEENEKFLDALPKR